jgi:hypothetical protein
MEENKTLIEEQDRKELLELLNEKRKRESRKKAKAEFLNDELNSELYNNWGLKEIIEKDERVLDSEIALKVAIETSMVRMKEAGEIEKAKLKAEEEEKLKVKMEAEKPLTPTAGAQIPSTGTTQEKIDVYSREYVMSEEFQSKLSENEKFFIRCMNIKKNKYLE